MLKCDFCNKTKNEVKRIIVGENGSKICNNCVDICVNILESENDKPIELVKDIDPIQLKEYLDKFVVSQDSAKTVLSVAVANHYKRINHSVKMDKSNVLLIGPTGSGKTMLSKTIAEYLHVPFAMADATTLTETGYVGDDVDSVLIKLYHAAGGNLQKAQQGIIFLDEVDKIARKGTNSTKDVGSEGVQQSLLKLVEGAVFTIQPNKKSEDTVDIDTSNILFIASGAFVGMEKITKRKGQPTQIGFTADVENHCLPEIEYNDFIEFGLIPEFIGRFPIIAAVHELSSDDMFNILTNIENNLVSQYKHLFKYNNVNLSFDKEALNQVVSIAIKKKTGARSLRSIMEKALLPHMYNINNYSTNNINKVRITKKLITNPAEVKQK